MRLRRRRPRPLEHPPFDYEATIAFLVTRGLDDTDTRFHSILDNHLAFIRATIEREVAESPRPLVGLHVGNYVGVSLAAFADALRTAHPDSTTIAIDPNFDTPGLANPQQHVIAVLNRYDLLASVLLVTGYSFEPTEFSDASLSGTNTLGQLGGLGVRFDVALIDGNHAGSTVSRELAFLEDRLAPGGLVFLDDVTDAWHEIRDAYASVAAGGIYEAIGHDGRIGVLKRLG